jgi:hypothetical protein
MNCDADAPAELGVTMLEPIPIKSIRLEQSDHAPAFEPGGARG